MNLREDKGKLRRELKGQAAGLDPAYCREADRAIFEIIKEMPEYRRARRIFSFVGTAREIHTVPIIEDALREGKVVGVPRCTGRGLMEVRRIHGLEGLKESSYGILEPTEAAALLLPEELDFAVVPCLSCTLGGRRLGYGGGYYDRYLIRTEAFKAVICRARLMRQDIPVEDHDVIMDAVISEGGVRRIRSVSSSAGEDMFYLSV